MKKLIFLQENTLAKAYNIYFLIFFFVIFFNSIEILAKEKWFIDKDISEVEFEVPVLLAKNVKGSFNNIEGYVELDLINKNLNKAIFSVDIKSLEINYNKYLELIFSDVFFAVEKYPLAVIDTKNFTYNNQNKFKLEAELTIKGNSEMIPINIEINKYSDDFVQILVDFQFLRSDYMIGNDIWSNTSILKDEIVIKTNIFLYKE